MVGFLKVFWQTISAMAPYLLVGFLVSGLLSVWLSAEFVRRHLGKGGWRAIIKAALFGVPLPLCSCGVIPVSLSLYKQGASKAATLSFLLSTPQTGVDSILVTYSLLGPVVALVRPIAAFLTGIFGGFLISVAEPYAPSVSVGEHQQETAVRQPVSFGHLLRQALWYGFVVLPTDIAPAMLAGIAIAAAINLFVPDDFFATFLAGGSGFLAMLAMMALGVPIYVCATASVPIALALIEKGVSPGAAMVFLIAGPATNAAGLTTLWSALGTRAAICYLLSVIVCAFATGFLLDWILSAASLRHSVEICHSEPSAASVLSTLFSVGLLVLLLFGAVRKFYRKCMK